MPETLAGIQRELFVAIAHCAELGGDLSLNDA
jgi:hypothetical protein